MDKMVECKNVVFKYSTGEEGIEKVAIDGLNLEVNKGEFLVILGHNGSGKSTVAKHMNALLTPTEGTVIVNGLDTANEDNIWDIRSTAGMVFQNPDNQLVATIVEEDVAFGPENLGVPPQEIRQRVDVALEKVGMSEYKRHAPHLSSGRKEVIDNIKELNKKHGITVILITHYMDEAAEADRVVVMDKGKVIIEGIPRDVFSHVETMKKIGLDVPQVTEICYELRKAGIEIDTKILNVNEMVSALCQLR